LASLCYSSLRVGFLASCLLMMRQST
jgi:hypothetical protein